MITRLIALAALAGSLFAQQATLPAPQVRRQCSATVTTNCFPGVGSTGAVKFPGSVSITSTLFNNAEFDNGTCTTAKTIDPTKGNRQKVTLTNAQTCALTWTQPASGTALVHLKVVQSTVASFDGTISGGKWPAGAVPVITATTGAVDVISCYLDGAAAYCSATQDFR